MIASIERSINSLTGSITNVRDYFNTELVISDA